MDKTPIHPDGFAKDKSLKTEIAIRIFVERVALLSNFDTPSVEAMGHSAWLAFSAAEIFLTEKEAKDKQDNQQL